MTLFQKIYDSMKPVADKGWKLPERVKIGICPLCERENMLGYSEDCGEEAFMMGHEAQKLPPELRHYVAIFWTTQTLSQFKKEYLEAVKEDIKRREITK